MEKSPKKQMPRWLKVLSVLAVGFVIGRYTAEPRENVIPADRPLVADDVPVAVEVVPTAMTPAVVDEPELASAVSVSPTVVGDTVGGDTAGDEVSKYVGTWYAEVHGTRLTTLEPDGTGVVHAKLDWVAALLYGSELQINVEWKVDGNIMTHTIVSGTPEKNIAALTRDFGTSKDYRIDKYEGDTMTLIDPGDGEVIVWHRREEDAKLD